MKMTYDRQFGFRKKCSIGSALLQFINEMTQAMDPAIAGVLSKAFDCVDHAVFLAKLRDYGMDGSCLSLIGSYLGSRKIKQTKTVVYKDAIKFVSK